MTHEIMVNRLKRIFTNRGQGMIEYILILGVLALAVIASLSPIGIVLAQKFTEFAEAISNS